MSLNTATGLVGVKLGPRKDCVLILCNDVLVMAESDLFGKTLSHRHSMEVISDFRLLISDFSFLISDFSFLNSDV
jgi:hypothetical protein